MRQTGTGFKDGSDKGLLPDPLPRHVVDLVSRLDQFHDFLRTPEDEGRLIAQELLEHGQSIPTTELLLIVWGERAEPRIGAHRARQIVAAAAS